MRPLPVGVNKGQNPSRFLAGVGYFVCTSVLVFALLNIVAHIGLPLWPKLHKATVTDPLPANPVYANYSWAADCLNQQLAKDRNAYLPFLLWGNPEVHGVCVNNDMTELGIVRRTVGPDCKNRPAFKLWVLGGSAAYGTMVPDWATLPSALSRILNTRAPCVQVTNLAVEGYNSNQELLLLVEELKAGHVPDVVVFYDGFNDADVGTSPSGPTTHLRYATVKQRLQGKFSIYGDLLQHFAIWRLADQITRAHDRTPLPRVSASELTERALATLDNYSQNIKIANVLGKTYGFRVRAFWQPALIYGHKPLVDYEQEFQRLSSQPEFFFQPLTAVYREAEQRERDGQFIFLGGVFDDVSQPTYLDWVHLNPQGNLLVAQAIAHALQDCVPAQEKP
jgi:hypothetical protein